MKELHVLLDFENVQPTLLELFAMAPGLTNVWLFYGPHQEKLANEFAHGDKRITTIPRSGQGKNALDFHLSFYLGYLASKHPAAHLVVVANDKGYDPMIAHANLLKFKVERLGYKAKRASAAKTTAKPAVKAPAKLAPKAPAKVVSKVPTKKRTKTPTKAATKTSLPPIKAAPVKKSPVKKVTTGPQAGERAELKDATRIQKSLSKMGDKVPHKLSSLLKHVSAMLGKSSTAEQIDAVMKQLEQRQTLRVFGDLVLYDKA